MKKIGLGIVGLGYMGNVHLRHSLKLSGAEVVAVADISRSALRNAREIGVRKTYTDYRPMLRDPEVDAVVISLPTHLHLESALEAAEHKKHIFLEKPIARKTGEAREIIEAARKNSVRLMIGYPLRFNTVFRDLKRTIKSGTLGDIELACATNIGSGPFFHRAEGYAPAPVPEWWFSKELTGGGVLIDLGSHMINLLRWYFGEITDIRSCLRYRFNLDLEDNAVCLAKFESGTRALITVGWFSQEYRLKVELMGTVKHAEAEHLPRNSLATIAKMLTTGTSRFLQPHRDELQYFVNCLVHDFPPSPSGQDGLKDLEAISLAYKNEFHLD